MSIQYGKLITFEGPDGCGKTTQIQRLAHRLENVNKGVLMTREPGGTNIGEEIRKVIKDPHISKNMCAEAELLLFAASRAQIVREVIQPSLAEGKFILCDRFLDSTTVYQGVARKINIDTVKLINNFAVGNLLPDLTFILDIPLEIGLERIQNRTSEGTDRMEMQAIEFYKAVRQGYLQLAHSDSHRFFVINGMQDRETIEETIWDQVAQRFL